MKNIPLLFFSIAFIFSIQVFAQGNQPNVSTQQTLQTQNPIENISVEISRIAKSGSTNAEEIRSNRRQLLYKQKSELNELLTHLTRYSFKIRFEISKTTR